METRKEYRALLKQFRENVPGGIFSIYKRDCVPAGRRGEFRPEDFGTIDGMGLTEEDMIESIVSKRFPE